MIRRLTVIMACISMLPCLMAAKPTSRLLKNARDVELFAAMKDGDLDVKLIPKDAKLSTVIIENKTKDALRIKLPVAFAGIPVLAQDGGDFGDFGGGGGLGGDQGGQNQNQAMGGGMMGGGMMGGGMMGGGGMFSVPAERVGKFKVKTVCLEHGKKDPNPRVPYSLRPIEDFTTDPNVKEVCAMLGRGEVDQVSAQAAAWHLTDKLSWQELAQKIKIRHLNGSVEMFFQPLNMHRAYKIVSVAKRRAVKKSPGETNETLED